jgi:hypothetical protein
VKLGQGNTWGCPLCDFLDLTKGNEYDPWEFGECPHCNNIGLATTRCLTCLLYLGNTITSLALKVTLKKYVDDLSCSLEISLPFGPTIFTIWRNRRKKWRPGIVCCGICCMRDLQLQCNHVSWFTGRFLHRWGTKCSTNRMS